MANGAQAPQDRGYIGVGLLGMGVVGGSVAEALSGERAALTEAIGLPPQLLGILVRDASKRRSQAVDASLITTDLSRILEDPRVDIVIELMGGEDFALSAIRTSIGAGKSVVTGNKEVMAKHGAGLMAMARNKNVALAFEAAVGGAIPVISSLQRGLAGTRISVLRAIINGTTNYILSQMATEGVAFSEALG